MNQREQEIYLDRIGYGGTVQKDTESLERLIRAHLEQVPFENLDVFDFGKIPSLKEEALFEKIVERHRGGYCFELNMLFMELLRSLGFFVYPVAVRVLWNKNTVPPVSHMALVVQLSEQKYLCDVGYGGPGPKGLLNLEESIQDIGGKRFRVSRISDGFLMERFHDEAWKAVMRFRDQPFFREDFKLLNFYCAANPDIMFRQKRIVNLCTPHGSRALADMELTIREGDQIIKRQLYNREELILCLKEEFGIRDVF